MALKWAGILVTVTALTLAVTANLFAADQPIPNMVNFLAIATAAVAIVVAIVADLYVRIDAKLNQMKALLVSRFDQLDAETGNHNTGFVEGYLLGHPADNGRPADLGRPDSAVVPMTPRGSRRSAAHGED